MTKLTEAQTRAVVTYLDEVADAARKLGEPQPLVADLATRLRAGVSFEDIKLWLTRRAVTEALCGHTDVTGLCGGLICALNLIEKVADADAAEDYARWHQEYRNTRDDF